MSPTRREWLQLAIYGVAWFGVYNVALNTAEQTLDAGTAAMIVNIGPILIALGAGVFLGEGIPRWLAIGAAVAFVGVVLIGIGTSLAQGSARPVDVVGAVFALAAAVTYAVGVLVQKPIVRRLPRHPGHLPRVPDRDAGVSAVRRNPRVAAGGRAIGGMAGGVYLGVVPTALAFSTWAYALRRMPAGQLGISTYLAPPLATLMGFLAFGEVPHPLALVGGVVCLVGVALSRRKSAVQ